MKIISIIAMLLLPIITFAQVKKITLQASGLTCSMCSNAINKSLQSLPFIDKTVPNIKTSSFDIYLKKGIAYSYDAIKENVEEAGFTVASFYVIIDINTTLSAKDQHTLVDGNLFHFINANNQQLIGERKIKIVDKGFVPAKEFKQNNKYTSLDCYNTGKVAACCNVAESLNNTRVYHVII
jgi:copper chaperone CopZ